VITVTVKRAYYDATHYGADEKGVLRVYRGDEVLAEYAASEDVTVGQRPDPFQFSPKLFGEGLDLGKMVQVYGS
jgi:hypothetical protein